MKSAGLKLAEIDEICPAVFRGVFCFLIRWLETNQKLDYCGNRRTWTGQRRLISYCE